MPAQLLRRIYRGWFRGESYWDNPGMNENLKVIGDHLPALSVVAVDPDVMPINPAIGDTVLFVADGTYKVWSKDSVASSYGWTLYPACKGLVTTFEDGIYMNTGSAWEQGDFVQLAEESDTTSTNLAVSPSYVTHALALALANTKNLLYPIGSIYTNASNSANPATLLGFGSWVRFGEGRVLIGVDSSNSLFDSPEETGGSKDAVVVSHSHSGVASATSDSSGSLSGGNGPGDFGAFNAASGAFALSGAPAPNGLQGSGGRGPTYNSVDFYGGNHTHPVAVDAAGQSGTNANLQPYITVYIWKRTA